MHQTRLIGHVMTKDALEQAILDLRSNKNQWARVSVADRIDILTRIRTATADAASEWAALACNGKQIPAGSELEGEEWLSGPYPLILACTALIRTLRGIQENSVANELSTRQVTNDQIAVRVVPGDIWDRLVLGGVTADVWMQPGVSAANLRENIATTYEQPDCCRRGSVSLVLGAGNINAIAPLDCFQKLFVEHSVVALKLNPANAYMEPVLTRCLQPLIDANALRIVTGGSDVGSSPCNHELVDSIHISGAGQTHDAIVRGTGEEAAREKKDGTPLNPWPFTSEPGAVCPTIVVPGGWSRRDLKYQAQQVATQTLHNSGFNCVATKVLVVPRKWNQCDEFLEALRAEFRNSPGRPLHYPGSGNRIDEVPGGYPGADEFSVSDDCRRVLTEVDSRDCGLDPEREEIYVPALAIKYIDAPDTEKYLRAAIGYCNEELHGTLGANIVIHPSTKKLLGSNWNEMLASLQYGCIAINTWTGLGFLLVTTPWGAYPGHTLDDVQSVIGFVQITYMLNKVEKTVIEAPFRPFTRSFFSTRSASLPKPPWFVAHKRAANLRKLLSQFQARRSLLRVPRIFVNALSG